MSAPPSPSPPGDADEHPGRPEPTRHFIHVSAAPDPVTITWDEARRYAPPRRVWRCAACPARGTARGEWAALDAVVVHAGRCRAAS